MLQRGNDEGLGAKITDCDWGKVGFRERAFGVGVKNALGEKSGALNGEECSLEFIAVGHVDWRVGGEAKLAECAEIWGEVGKLLEEERQTKVYVREGGQG